MNRDDWARLRERLERPDLQAARLLVGLGFDGVLSEIVDRPAEATLADQAKRALHRLCARADSRVAVLSGRDILDLKRRVRLLGVYYAGNDGLQVQGPDIRWAHPQARFVGRDQWRPFADGLESIPGAFIEHKRLGAAVHYRLVPPRLLRRVRELVRSGFPALNGRYQLREGKKSFEIRPAVAWNKGHAFEMMRKALEREGAWSAVYVGDDAGDEEAFRTLGPRALTVRVGRVAKSAAEFVIPQRGLVDRLLEALAARRGRAGGGAPSGREPQEAL